MLYMVDNLWIGIYMYCHPRKQPFRPLQAGVRPKTLLSLLLVPLSPSRFLSNAQVIPFPLRAASFSPTGSQLPLRNFLRQHGSSQFGSCDAHCHFFFSVFSARGVGFVCVLRTSISLSSAT